MLWLCLGNWNCWNKLICSQDPSSCNRCWDRTSFLESHSNTRCADQPYLIAEGCVCVCAFVCILGSSLRTGCLAPYVRSVRGNWENKVLRVIATSCLPELCLKTGNMSHTAVRGACGNGLCATDLWPINSTPARSLTPTPLVLKHAPLGPSLKIDGPSLTGLSLTQAAELNPAPWDLFGWPMKNRWTLEGPEKKKRKRGRQSGSLVKYLWRKITQGHCLITSICLAWFCWGGRVVTPAALRFSFPHYVILMYKKRAALDLVGGLW